MENLANISSEEELLQLRNEGKISEDEYEELRGAMRKSTKTDFEPPPAADKAKSKRKLGKIAFYLMLGGIVLGPVCYCILAVISPNNLAEHGPWLLMVGLPLEIAAFVIGVIAWPDIFAKAAVVTVSVLLVLLIVFTA